MATLPTPTDWVLGPMAEGRKSALERLLPFEDLARQIAAQAVVAPPLVEDANDRSAPPRTIRAAFRLQADPETLDIFHNGIAGLRANYWAAPAMGDKATATVIRCLAAKLLAQVPVSNSRPLRSKKGIEMSRAAIKKALSERSAKVWIDEAQRTKDGEALHVSRWAENESEPKNLGYGAGHHGRHLSK